MFKDSNGVASKIALDIMIELYNKNIWTDSKTVNVISTGCFSKIAKILATALKFFLGSDKNENGESESESDDDDNMPSASDLANSNKVNKKTRKRKRLLARTKQVVKKQKKKSKPESFNFSAIHLLNDPQSFAENLFKSLETFNERYELKLLLINLISRLVGIHELFLLNFYPYLQRYMHSKQQDVTKILQYLAQASHELVPPDVLEPLLKLIANNFVTERNSNEVMAVGINSIREICARCPLAMNEDLLQDLVAYNSFRDKNVSMAAKSLIQLYRVVNPGLLKKKDRGRPTEATVEQKVYQYGDLKAVNYIAGTEVLEAVKEESVENVDEIISDEDDDDDDDGSWINVSQSDDELYDDKSDEEANESKEDINSVEKARLISSTRILTQEEFQKVKAAQMSKQLRAAKPKRFKKAGQNDDTDFSFLASLEKKEVVPLNQIEKLYKRSKADKAARLESIKTGREDRGKFGSRKGKLTELSSNSNKQLKKTKSFQMIKHKLNQKRKKSFKEKQVALKNALLKRCKQG